MKTISPEKIKKILCIKPRGIGDVVGATIMLPNLRVHFPSAELHFLLEDFAEEIVSGNPHISKVLTYNRKDGLLSIVRKVRRENYDIVLDTYCNPRTALVTLFSGAKYRVGFPYNWRKIGYNIYANHGAPYAHFAEHNFHILEAIGCPHPESRIQCFEGEEFASEARSFFEANFSGSKPVIGILPTGGWSSKTCEPEKWAEIIHGLRDAFGVEFIIFRGPAEVESAQKIFDGASDCSRLAPMGRLKSVMAYMKLCRAIVATDSGMMHVSAALGLPTVGLFGQSSPENFAPYNEQSSSVTNDQLDCLDCGHRECPRGHECMLELPVSSIADRLRGIV